MNFEDAVIFLMRYEVGPNFKLDVETLAGLIETRAQKRKVGYVFDAYDEGGETKYGVAQYKCPDVAVKTLTWDGAKTVYKKQYWDKVRADSLPEKTAIVVFDCAVNHGVMQATKFLQRAIGAKDDGILGKATLAKVQGISDLSVSLNILAQRREFFLNLVHMKPAQGRFLAGWLARCADLEKYVT